MYFYYPYFYLFIGSFVQKDEFVSSVENRNLARIPALPHSLASFIEYPEKFNSYYADNFGFRGLLNEAYFMLTDKRINKTPFDDVTFGQNEWLFLGSIKPGYDRYDDPIGDAINKNLFTKEELNDFARSLIKIDDWLKNRGIEYLYIIAPNKHTIYFEHLPDYIKKINDKSAMDQLMSYLKKHTNVNVLDLRDCLFDEKKKHQVYFKSDTHWNHYGANVVQYEILKKIRSLFPLQINPHLLGYNQFSIESMQGGDLAGIAKIQNVVETDPKPIFEKGCLPRNETPENTGEKTHTLVCETKKLNAIIFRDSFFEALKPYISRQFNRSTYIWGRVDYSLLTEFIEKEKPDIVIEEVIERALPYKINSDLFDVSD